MKLLFFGISIILIANSCCSYFPLVDHNYMRDFETKSYQLADSVVVNSDSLYIVASTRISLPANCRARKLRTFFFLIDLDIKRNLYDNAVIISLGGPNHVTVQTGNSLIIGVPRLTSDSTECYIKIIKTDYFVVQGAIKADSLVFNYKHSSNTPPPFHSIDLKVKCPHVTTADK